MRRLFCIVFAEWRCFLFALGVTLGGGVLVAFHDGHWLPTVRLPRGLAVVNLAIVDAEPGVIAYDVTCETSGGERSLRRWFVLSGMLGRMEGVGGR